MCITNVAVSSVIDLLFRPCDRALHECNANVLCAPATVFTMTHAQSVALFRAVVLPASLARHLNYEMLCGDREIERKREVVYLMALSDTKVI